MARKSMFLLILLLVLCLAFRQILNAQPALPHSFAKPTCHPPLLSSLLKQNSFKPLNNRYCLNSTPSINTDFSKYHITPRQWPLFCRLEWQLEKRSPLPCKFRLGSIDYVNYLEKK